MDPFIISYYIGPITTYHQIPKKAQNDPNLSFQVIIIFFMLQWLAEKLDFLAVYGNYVP